GATAGGATSQLCYLSAVGAAGMNELTAGPPARTVLVYDQIAANQRRTLLLLLGFAVLLVPVALGVWDLFDLVTVHGVRTRIEPTPGAADSTILDSVLPIGASLLFIVFATVLQYLTASRQVLRRLGARRLQPADEPALWRSVANLCIGAGLPMPALYLIE